VSRRLAAAAVPAVCLLAAPAADGAVPGQNGRLLTTVAGAGELRTVLPNGASPGRVAVPAPNASSFNGVMDRARWSPDGTKIVFAYRTFVSGCSFTQRSTPVKLRIMNADGTGLKDLTKAACPSQPQQDREPAWSPDGRKVVFVRATNVDSDARIRAGSLMTVDVASGATTRLSAFPAGGPGDLAPAYSPDGRRIAFERAGDLTAGDEADIWVMNADGTARTQLTSGAADDRDPDWSPDGARLVFSSDRDTARRCLPAHRTGLCDHEIYAMAPTGADVTRLTFRPDDEDSAPAWSPDGTRIAWQGSTPIPNPLDKPVPDVWTMAPDGSEKANVTGAMRTSGRFPDTQHYPRPDWQRVATAPSLPAPALRLYLDAPSAYGNSTLPATVYLGAVAPAGGTIVQLTSSSPDATVPATVTVPAGEARVDVPVAHRIPAATHAVDINAAIPGRSATGRFTLYKAAEVSGLRMGFGDPDVLPGGRTAIMFVDLDAPAPDGSVVALESSDPAALRVPASLPVLAGFNAAQFTIDTTPVTTTTPVTVSATYAGKTVTKVVTVRPGRRPTLSLSPSAIVGAAGTSVTATVTVPDLPASEGTALTVASSDPLAYPERPDLTIFAGSNATTFKITAPQAVSEPVTVTITVTHEGVSASAPLTITPAGSTAPAPAPEPAPAPTPAPAPATDTVTVTLAEYVEKDEELSVEATSTSSTATLRAYTQSGILLGTLTNAGGGRYRATFEEVANPGTVRVESSLGGSATRTVTVDSRGRRRGPSPAPPPSAFIGARAGTQGACPRTVRSSAVPALPPAPRSAASPPTTSSSAGTRSCAASPSWGTCASCSSPSGPSCASTSSRPTTRSARSRATSAAGSTRRPRSRSTRSASARTTTSRRPTA
jgi:Tol biopolymer transport system component